MLLFLLSVASSAMPTSPTPGSEERIVDLAFGGIQAAARVLQARHGVTIDVELAPLAPTDLVVFRDREGVLFPMPALQEVRFSYPASTGVDGALAALVAAWSEQGGPGSPYVVQRVGEVRRLVPTTRRGPDGRAVLSDGTN